MEATFYIVYLMGNNSLLRINTKFHRSLNHHIRSRWWPPKHSNSLSPKIFIPNNQFQITIPPIGRPNDKNHGSAVFHYRKTWYSRAVQF